MAPESCFLCALVLVSDHDADVEVLITTLSGSFGVSMTGKDTWSLPERGWQESCPWEEPQHSSPPGKKGTRRQRRE